MTLPPPNKVLRLRDVVERLGISRSSLYEKLSPTSPRYDNTFPRPFKLGASSIGWLESSIDTWLELRIQFSAGAQMPIQQRNRRNQNVTTVC
ncbi:AlpA family transcriptional regulator [Undibacterium sp. 14-3-2]|uniref:helix-turn-helix transcriptional regulator n=1 Tax=Undibacterium sp. 14-3-2 TaxID=2800129 RepID=UPI00190495B0|nr:AlpA family transcriptional regulator [Undibacterium sp. 14-3-2]MBK1889294.1 AlpA family transcriptional regulator [Undibacterium sp. 14-3-2]